MIAENYKISPPFCLPSFLFVFMNGYCAESCTVLEGLMTESCIFNNSNNNNNAFQLMMS